LYADHLSFHRVSLELLGRGGFTFPNNSPLDRTFDALNPSQEKCRETELDEEDDDDSAAGAVRRLQRTLCVEVEVNSGTSAHTAILEASALSSETQIIELPHWLMCPNKYSQNWILYSLLSLGLGYGAIYLVRSAVVYGLSSRSVHSE
jgi:hypothetical protein